MMLECLLMCALSAGDWPQFRGPNADGHAEGPPTPLVWSETQNVVWKTEIPGLGWSSTSIVGGRVFLTTAVPRGEGLSLRALALDAETGHVVWDREVRALEKTPAIHPKNSHASPTPIVRDGKVYVHFGAQGMARLSADDGAIEWTCFDFDYPPVHGNGGTPVLHDGKLVVACDGSSQPFVVSVDADTGKIAWKTPRSVKARLTHSFVTATVAMVDGQAQVLADAADGISGPFDVALASAGSVLVADTGFNTLAAGNVATTNGVGGLYYSQLTYTLPGQGMPSGATPLGLSPSCAKRGRSSSGRPPASCPS